jgi:hypothetical protein
MPLETTSADLGFEARATLMSMVSDSEFGLGAWIGNA